MARVIYTKHNELKLFGLKIFSFKTDYSERSNSKDIEEDDFYMGLHDRIDGVKDNEQR